MANFRGGRAPRNPVVKLGDTCVALDDRLDVLWAYQTPKIQYGQCPDYIPAAGAALPRHPATSRPTRRIY